MTGVWMHGPRAAAVLEQIIQGATGLADWLDYQHTTATFEGEPVSTARIDQLGVPGYCVFLAATSEERFVAVATAAGARVVAPDVLHAARIEAGYPLFGTDMTADTIPLEAGIEQRAISFTKGCFVGQEVVIRVLHRGGGRVAKRLVGFRLTTAAEGQSVGHPFKGAKVFSAAREIGVLTSVATSSRLGVIALGYVHRDFTTPGAEVQVDGHAAIVLGLPMA
jgi:folate-binding protein YgfZ